MRLRRFPSFSRACAALGWFFCRDFFCTRMSGPANDRLAIGDVLSSRREKDGEKAVVEPIVTEVGDVFVDIDEQGEVVTLSTAATDGRQLAWAMTRAVLQALRSRIDFALGHSPEPIGPE